MTLEQKAQEYANNYDNILHEVIAKQSFLAGYNADKSELDKEVNYWKERCKAAEEYIENTPCDPDIYTAQIVAYKNWQTLKNKENENTN